MGVLDMGDIMLSRWSLPGLSGAETSSQLIWVDLDLECHNKVPYLRCDCLGKFFAILRTAVTINPVDLRVHSFQLFLFKS